MMPSDRFDRRLPVILEEISQPRTPDYFDDLLGLAARTRQRPAWTLLERWLPMADIARQPAFARQVPWRPIAVLALIFLLVVASLALVIGSRHPLPAPFGLAKNGLVAYATAGDIYTADSATGASTAIVGGPETDVDPRWSRDGTRVAFQRMADGNAYAGDVYVARPDGSDLIRVTREPLAGITGYDFSPDGKQLLISAPLNGIPSLLIAATDGSEIHQLDVGMAATKAAWRPPNGSEILFMDDGDDSGGDGAIHLVSSGGGDVRTIVDDQRSAGIYRGHPLWSPDGSLIAYGEWCNTDCSTGEALAAGVGLTAQTYIVRADGSPVRILPSPAGQWQAPESWSNDGTRILVIRGDMHGDAVEQARPAAVPIDGSASGVEIPYPGGMSPTETTAWEWAPDDASILATPTSAAGTVLDQVLLDPVNGTFRTLAWTSASDPSWQRIAP